MSNKTISILIADDHHIVRTGLKIALDCGNHSVVGEAENGQSTIEQAALLNPDVILIDLSIPIVDGITATKIIKVQFPSIRILVISADHNEDQVFAALGAGADGYCLKESSTEQLKLAIDAVYSGAIWLDARIRSSVLKFLHTSADGPNGDSAKIVLSPRETQVLKLIVEGYSNQEIANKLFLGIDTVKSHVRTLMRNLAVHDRTQAAVKAIRQRLV